MPFKAFGGRPRENLHSEILPVILDAPQTFASLQQGAIFLVEAFERGEVSVNARLQRRHLGAKTFRPLERGVRRPLMQRQVIRQLAQLANILEPFLFVARRDHAAA